MPWFICCPWPFTSTWIPLAYTAVFRTPSWIYLTRRRSFEREPQYIYALSSPKKNKGWAQLEEGRHYHVGPAGGHSMVQVSLCRTATHSGSRWSPVRPWMEEHPSSSSWSPAAAPIRPCEVEKPRRGEGAASLVFQSRKQMFWQEVSLQECSDFGRKHFHESFPQGKPLSYLLQVHVGLH